MFIQLEPWAGAVGHGTCLPFPHCSVVLRIASLRQEVQAELGVPCSLESGVEQIRHEYPKLLIQT